MPRCNHRTHLFPYTTLFRSGYRLRKFVRRNKRALATVALVGLMLFVAGGAVIASALWAMVEANARAQIEINAKEQLEDRKSTRLNSSHLGISYAVFCLKKKK